MSYKQNNFKNAIHGFFLALATAVSEVSTVLPLIVYHFSHNLIIIGLFASLLRGGAIVVQLFAAFYAQSFRYVMPYMKIVFLFRFLSWFFIGLCIYLVGDKNHTLSLWMIGIGLFVFSFSAGFGGIYFKEIIAKVFSKDERGKTMSNKQFFASLGSLLGGGVAGVVLHNFAAPQSYAYLFMVSSFLMGIGLFVFSTIDEPPKENISTKEDSFILFMQNAINILKKDRRLKLQIIITLLGYSFLLSISFIIIRAKESFDLTGFLIGSFISVQMIGSMVGNLLLWKKLTNNYIVMMRVALSLMILLFLVALAADSIWDYVAIFLLFGIARDGFRNADINLILEIAPEDKRPVYVAIQSTLTSFGLFFAIPGGFIVEHFGYNFLYIVTILMLLLGLFFTKKLSNL